MSRVLLRFTVRVTGVLNNSNRFALQKFVFGGRKCFRTFNYSYTNKKDGMKMPVVATGFSETDEKNKEVFLEVINRYKIRETHRRGHVEFINGALKYMKEFGVEKDLEVYRTLIDVMPKGKFVPQNFLQAEFMHFPKQQECILELLSMMEYHKVIPDPELGELLINIFGNRGYPVRKFMRMLYWMPKLKNLSPWPLPDRVPKEPFDLAMLAIKRITSVDPATKISVFSTRLVEDAVDDTWIISGQSIEQQQLLSKHDGEKPVFIEGAFRIWLRDSSVYYFTLRADPLPPPKPEETIDVDDISKLNIKNAFFSPPVSSELEKIPSVHEQEDGVYYAVCATGSSGKDSLLSWIRLLQKENPRLSEVPVLFRLHSPTKDKELTTVEGNTSNKSVEKQTFNKDSSGDKNR